MTAPLTVADITSYLADTGWQRQPESWRGAAIWSDRSDHDVLVPARDDLGDSDLRIREIVDLLTAVEGRSRDEITLDIGSPMMDVQSYFTFNRELPLGQTTIADGLDVVRGVRDLIDLTTRAVLMESRAFFSGSVSGPVNDMLRRIRLYPARSTGFGLTTCIPADVPLGRSIGEWLGDTVKTVAAATTGGDRSAIDVLTEAGISAELCDALGLLAGEYGRLPFEIRFRWARGVPSARTVATVTFPAGTGATIRAAGDRLRDLPVNGLPAVTMIERPAELVAEESDATVTGIVESLHDDPFRDNRWRARVRGRLTTQGGTRRRTLWIRFADSRQYELAIEAQRGQRQIQASGTLSTVNRYTELRVDTDGFDTLD